MWQDEIARDGQPGHADHKHCRHIGEERQRQPPQDRGIALVTREHFERDGDDCKTADIEDGRAGDEEAQGGGHRAEVCAKIDRVGDHQEADQEIKHGGRIIAAHVLGEAISGDPSHPGADHLDRAHQRIGQQKRPTQRIAKLRPGLGIGGDAAWVVVRGSSDQARA